MNRSAASWFRPAKKLCAIALLGLMGAAVQAAEMSIRVTGVGESVEAAKQDGLRTAVQQVVGAVVVSERQVVNDELTEESITHANGVVDRYQVIQSYLDRSDRLYRVEMTVTVSPSVIQRRLLAETKASDVDGDSLAEAIKNGRAQINSERDRLISAGKLLRLAIKDLHLTLYDVKVDSIQTVRQGTEIKMVLPVQLTPNADMVKSVCAATNTVRQALRQPFKVGNAYDSPDTYAFNCTDSWAGNMLHESIPMSRPTFESVTHAASRSSGICLALLNRRGEALGRLFFPLNLLQEYADGIGGQSSSMLVQRMRPPLYVTKLNRTTFILVNDVGKASTQLVLPDSIEPYLQQLSKVTASMAYQEKCQ